MSQFGQLVCFRCRKILSYPLGAISCRCRNCGTINPAQNLHVTCGCCSQSILVPINTLTFLCPCCATVTDIPQSLLPPVEGPVNMGTEAERAVKTIYVTYPAKARPKSDVKEHMESLQREGEEEEEEGSDDAGTGGNILVGGAASPNRRKGKGNGAMDADDSDQATRDVPRSMTNRLDGSNVVMVVGTRIL